jgi:hypothetical protein
MRPESKGTPVDMMAKRLKLLPHRLRVVHLRALIGRQLPGSIRRRELAGLLRDEMMPRAGQRGALR